MENIKQLQKLAEVFDTDKIITSDEIEQVLKGILVIMNSFKKDNQTLNKETKEVVEILLDKVLTENAKLKELVNRETSDQKEDFAKQVKELKDLVSKVQTIKPIDGVDGKDADEEKIVEDVLAKIKLPEYEVYTLEEKGEDIVAEINALPTNEDEYKIDFSHIKNAPEFRGGSGSTARNLYQLMDVQLSAPTDNQVLTYDATSNTWKNENSAGGGGAWGTITGTLSDQTDLQTALDTKVDENVAITGATKTKITYDAKGLVTAGADATTADIADSSNKRYVTDAQLTVIGNTSGTNTGDQDISGKADKSGALTQFVGNGNYKVWYSDGSGDVTELALGADGTFLKSNGASAAPTFATPTGSGDVSKVGTPVSGQVGYWTGDGTLAGDTGMTYDATGNVLTATGFVGALTGNADTVTNGVYTTGAGSVFEVPLTFGDGLTRTLNDVDLDTTLNILKISGLTSNGFVKTSGGDGTLSVDTNTYLTSLSGAVLTDQTVGQTIGLTGSRLTKLWATDITVTNAITGSVTGNAGTVTNATLTTALTVNTGTVTLTGNVANSSVLTIGAGAVSVSGSNTGDNAVNSLYSGLVTNATHTGDATGATALTVVAINGTNLAALGTGILKNTTGTGVPSIAVAGDFPTLNQNTTGSAATLTTTRTIWGQNFNGSANVTGDITLGTGNITMTGSIGATGARATKVWTADLESTNMPTVGGTSLSTTFAAKSGALTQFVGNGNYKVFYSDGSGDVQELALGADGTFLKSNGASSVPSFATPSGGSSTAVDSTQSVYNNYEMDFTGSGATATGDTWNVNGTLNAATRWNGKLFRVTFGTNTDITQFLPGNIGSSSAFLQFGNGKDITISWNAKYSSVSGQVGIGISDSTDAFYAVANDGGKLMFTYNGTTLNAVNGETSETTTDVSTGITRTNWNAYKIVYTYGTDVKFYINNTLVATHTTNLPTSSSNARFGIGGATSGNTAEIANVVISVEK